MEKRIEQGLDQRKKPVLFSFEWFLLGASRLYGLGVAARLYLYKKGRLKQKKLPCFVISVGNITVGGTGKTPMTVYLAEQLKKMGRKPVVVSRGYKGEYKGSCEIVSDGETIFCTAGAAGDEPFMMAQRKEFPVVVGRNRVLAGNLAVKRFNCDVIVLDDGFQHLKAARDLDLVLMDGTDPLGNCRLLPAGRLREPPGRALSRADALIFTRTSQTDKAIDKLPDHLAIKKNLPCFTTFHSPFIQHYKSCRIPNNESFPDLHDLRGKKALLFSGLARNAYFFQSVKAAGIIIVSHLEFKDHYRYKKADIKQINRKAVQKEADLILTTEKDWSKLNLNNQWTTDIAVVGIRICFHNPDAFNTFLKEKLSISHE